MHHWIDSAGALSDVAERLARCPRIGFDTEFMRVRTYWPELALLQTSDGSRIDLIDPVALPDLSALRAMLTAPTPVKLLHSASEDLVALAPIAQAPIGGLFDTQVAAAFAGLGPGIGYQRLVLTVVNVELAKAETRSNWLARPLSDAQLAYAEADVEHLFAVHDALMELLTRRNMLDWCLAECQRLADNAALGDGAGQPHHEFKSLWRWPDERQYLLRRVLDWREATARAVNRPRLWIFDNPTAVQLAEARPTDTAAINALLSSQRAFPKRALGDLIDCLTQPIDDASLVDFSPIPPPLRGEDERRFDEARDRIAARAQALDLPPALIASRRQIEALIRGEGTAQLAPWRRQALGDALSELVAS